MKKKLTFIETLAEMDVDFEVPSANANGQEEAPGEISPTDSGDDMQVDVATTVTLDSDFFAELLQGCSDMDEEELAAISAEMIEKAKTKKVLTMDDFDTGDDSEGIEDTMDDEMPDQTQTPGQVDQNEMLPPEEECEMSY